MGILSSNKWTRYVRSKRWACFNKKRRCTCILILLITSMFILHLEIFRIKELIPEFFLAEETLTTEPTRTTFTDIVPLSVYFDPRALHGHDNATVIFVSVLKDYRESILGCEVDEVEEFSARVVDISVTDYIEENFNVTHIDCFVYCYDMEIDEQSLVNVIYSRNGTAFKELVKTSVVIPRYGEEEDAVMVCATGYGTVPNLDQWLIYQQTIGIKFIHINIHPSFLANLNSSSVLQNFVDSNYVNMTVWEEYLNTSQVFYYSQSLKYQDCLLRYLGLYKYMMIVDFDEYFIPFGIKKDVYSYIRNIFKRNVGQVIFSRQEYTCKARGFEDMAMPSDGNLTILYNNSHSLRCKQGKSVVLVKAVEQSSVHMAGALSPRYYTVLDYLYSPHLPPCQVAHLITHSTDICGY